MKTIAVIPARYRSSRLPGKPLSPIEGRSMIEHVVTRAQSAATLDSVLVATDDKRIYDDVTSFGGKVVMTSPDHVSGTDRVAEACQSLEADFVVNLQGDEPLIATEAIDDAVRLAHEHPEAIATLKYELRQTSELLSPHVVKVVATPDGRALYFSRSPIPHLPRDAADELPAGTYFKHIGLYVYPLAILQRVAQLAPSPLEEQERLEQLRALEAGIEIRVTETGYDSISVDTQSDLDRVRELVLQAESSHQGKGASNGTTER